MLPSAQFDFDMCAGAYRCLKMQKKSPRVDYSMHGLRLTTRLTWNSGKIIRVNTWHFVLR